MAISQYKKRHQPNFHIRTHTSCILTLYDEFSVWDVNLNNWETEHWDNNALSAPALSVVGLILKSNFLIESLELNIDSLWWRWFYITFHSSWSRLKQWVSLNNRRSLSSVEAPQLLVQLSQFVLSSSLSSCAHWHKLIPVSYYLTHAFSPKLPWNQR